MKSCALTDAGSAASASRHDRRMAIVPLDPGRPRRPVMARRNRASQRPLREVGRLVPFDTSVAAASSALPVEGYRGRRAAASEVHRVAGAGVDDAVRVDARRLLLDDAPREAAAQ